MRSPFANALRTSLATLRRVAGGVVLYQRGDQSVQWMAIKGSTLWQGVNTSGTVIDVDLVDWIGATTELAINGVLITPQSGDRIIEQADDGDHVYQVVPGPAQQPWRYSDETRSTIRVHTQRVEGGAS